MAWLPPMPLHMAAAELNSSTHPPHPPPAPQGYAFCEFVEETVTDYVVKSLHNKKHGTKVCSWRAAAGWLAARIGGLGAPGRWALRRGEGNRPASMRAAWRSWTEAS
jgi:hypothetical protein